MALGVGMVVVASACGGGEPPPKVAKKESILSTIASGEKPVVAPPPKKDPPRPDPTLLARNILFSNPDRARPLLSPDGKRIAYLSSVDGVLNVWVAPVAELAKAIVSPGDNHTVVFQSHRVRTSSSDLLNTHSF